MTYILGVRCLNILVNDASNLHTQDKLVFLKNKKHLTHVCIVLGPLVSKSLVPTHLHSHVFSVEHGYDGHTRPYTYPITGVYAFEPILLADRLRSGLPVRMKKDSVTNIQHALTDAEQKGTEEVQEGKSETPPVPSTSPNRRCRGRTTRSGATTTSQTLQNFLRACQTTERRGTGQIQEGLERYETRATQQHLDNLPGHVLAATLKHHLLKFLPQWCLKSCRPPGRLV